MLEGGLQIVHVLAGRRFLRVERLPLLEDAQRDQVPLQLRLQGRIELVQVQPALARDLDGDHPRR